jgi:Leucine-rich repeat (LRR) protein
MPDVAAAGNELTALPLEIGSLRELKYLNVMGNRLRSLPDEIGQLNKLSR